MSICRHGKRARGRSRPRGNWPKSPQRIRSGWPRRFEWPPWKWTRSDRPSATRRFHGPEPRGPYRPKCRPRFRWRLESTNHEWRTWPESPRVLSPCPARIALFRPYHAPLVEWAGLGCFEGSLTVESSVIHPPTGDPTVLPTTTPCIGPYLPRLHTTRISEQR